MPSLKNLNNVYVIDNYMFDFPEYSSCFLIKGKELAMVDTGMPNQTAVVLAAIKKHGFSVADITRIFITHEHTDHAGNIAPILELAPRAKVYINPAALKDLLDPSIQLNAKARTLPEKMVKRFGTTKPTPRERMVLLEDGAVCDLGDEVRLRIEFTNAHQPGGVIIFDEKNSSLFINDLGGMYFEDCGYHRILHPRASEFFVEYAQLRKLAQIPLRHLYLGHYGIVVDGPLHIQRSLKRMEEMIDIGKSCLAAGQKEKIAELIHEKNAKEAEKLLRRGDKELYEYVVTEHIPFQAKTFARLFLKEFDS